MKKCRLLFTLLLFLQAVLACAQQSWHMQPTPIKTRWAADVSPENPWPEYPRPQLQRPAWQNLNGLWDYAITPNNAPRPKTWQGKILVPFPLESALSGVKKPLLPNQQLWYNRNFNVNESTKGKHILLHFGAVDWQATVYVNGKKAGAHTGGYQAFTLDITALLQTGDNNLTVAVYDPTDQGINPHGKQVLQPQGIRYTASSGIWQTVWLEAVPEVYITDIKITPADSALKIQVNTNTNATAAIAIMDKGKVVATATVPAGQEASITIPQVHHWSPEDPFLYDINIKLQNNDQPGDEVNSYAGMRTIAIKKDEKGQERIFLNGKYTYNLGVLDQGFWPDGGYTAPTDEALRFDIEAVKAMGFNTIRKHIKLEPARWYYHCDKLGILVWQDMVTAGDETPAAKKEFENENKENIALLYNYPSIICWVLFNEGWARYDQQRLTEWMKSTDPGRIINGHTGENYDRRASQDPNQRWISSDLTDIHDYPGPGIAPSLPGKARVLGEWGGVQVRVRNHQWNAADGWGYISVLPSQFASKYAFMVKHLKIYEEEGLSGSIYTEPFDVETEENGLITYDREIIKIPVQQIRAIHELLIPPTAALAADFKIRDMDTSNPDNRYTAMLQDFLSGKRDTGFLKELAPMAARQNDPANAKAIAAAYMGQLTAPYTRSQWNFIFTYTSNTDDKGFNLINTHRDAANRTLGGRQADIKLMNIIYSDKIAPFITGTDENPDWTKMAASIKPFGLPGAEIYLRAKTIYHMNNKEWKHFAGTADKYIQQFAATISAADLNKFAWSAFTGYTDSTTLLTAATWSKLSMRQGEVPAYMDTHANLLYKAGKKTAAIAMEEKALKMAPPEEKKNYEDTLGKMKNNQQTW
ncbi:glycoside hydrolase family 2 protein [Chitinophaga sp. Cy-1792]|uniref:glycoside hydrolase family 2 protein n=1 Tax=Chitinophaga sp. Cy-1792 TaxID=2608339 RepID=UPI001421CEA0|nr:sugar-binding domain-containing protein [Chitinophaga sp. Cy-1792]NIG56462.1 glycoside hydrolase family 2 [Chitinophaga sp. Cy-1792]